jgi:hypothetical protein
MRISPFAQPQSVEKQSAEEHVDERSPDLLG